MTRTFSTVAVVAMSMALSATAAGGSQDKIPQLPRRDMTDMKSTTLTGCVARGTAPDTYTLTETQEGAAAPTDATPRLAVALSSTDVDLGKHVGHSVSVTGLYARADVPTATAGTEKPSPAPTAAIEDDKITPRAFAVKSLKMVAASCVQPAE